MFFLKPSIKFSHDSRDKNSINSYDLLLVFWLEDFNIKKNSHKSKLFFLLLFLNNNLDLKVSSLLLIKKPSLFYDADINNLDTYLK